MNLSVLIVEDNANDIAILTDYLKKIPYLNTITVASNTADALEGLMKNAYDLVFMDIEMPDMNGMTLLQSVEMPPTIIVSAHPSYAIASFDIDSVVDFIQKPVTFARLLRALKRIHNHLPINENKHLYLKVGRQTQLFNVADIRYVEADGIYSKVWYTNGSFTLVNDNISEVEKKALNTRLLRLQKSYIFNLDYITAFDSRTIWVGDMKFLMGVQYRKKLAQLLHIEDNFE